MKKCSKCKIEKGLNEFAKNKQQKDGLANQCKKCHKMYADAFAKKYPEVIKERRYKRKLVHRRWYLDILSQLSCFECDEDDNRVLDWHHEDPESKKGQIGDMVNRLTARKRIIAEMKKCIVICSNCHRKLHYNDKVNIIEHVI